MMASTQRAWKLQEFVAHGSSVRCLAFGKKSGRVMVTGGEDKKVNLWAVGKPNCIMSLTGHTTAVECVKFGQVEDMVCAGSVAGTMKIWNLEEAKILRTLTGHKSNVKCLDFHPFGEFLASGSLDTTLKLWDIRRKGCIYTYKGHDKPVNTIKFSPDGRWIASAGDDGTIQLWDLPAGKKLTEFRSHSGPVVDIEFHPNEFLLASCSTDRSVRFWDLESFQQVSSIEGETGPTRCIYFNPGGECLFYGALDVLKVYGWEPSRTYDTLVLGWGKVTDISTSQNQLIAGAFSLTNVSVYVVDLKRVRPFGIPPTSRAKSFESQPAFSPNGQVRKSFNRRRPVGKEALSLKVKSVENSDSAISQSDSGGESQSYAEIKEQGYYKEIFHPSKVYLGENKNLQSEETKTAEKLTPAPFVAPVQKSSSPIVGRKPEKMSAITTSIPDSGSSLSSPSLNSTYTIVKPIPIVPEKEIHPQKAVVFNEDQYIPTFSFSNLNNSVPVQKPQKRSSNSVNFVPDQRDHPAELDMEAFLPKHLQSNLCIRGQPQPQLSEAEAMSSIFKGHQSIIQGVSKNAQSIKFYKVKLWNLNICQLLLPTIYDLLQSKFESYISVGCTSLRLILKNFVSVIKTNVTAPPSVGVDISREERHNKCASCYNHLLSIRAFLLKRQTMQGKLGHSFRELHMLMQGL
ncbi:katanin p80 WD40 repeat-containing subunit B1-like [Limulus polyphemus]|uniref:Katanin p80 WD40 repeat-containing subunit B1 n=1 Tax=Limulus polyphemus TaxID=6850 RepID=A0ABM1S1E7_LIMPO|nr:katanin p80 WD40 repeat-containing subunit B1-like [Limulus polyphemus]